VVDVSVSAARSNGSLILSVRDRGRGLTNPAPPWGVGLTNTFDRLSHLYGDRQKLSIENAEGGGLIVTVALPFHGADA
jgi:LytS/YehU family sensor histidine kinase